MKNWSEKDFKKLKQKGMIRDYQVSERKKGFSGMSQPKTSKALDWLKWNLMFWANEKALTLESEYRFCKDRAFRFDFCFPSIKCAVEFEGGIFLENSGHNTARHYTKDTEKYNRAAVLGWKVIRVTALNYTTVLSQLNEILKK